LLITDHNLCVLLQNHTEYATTGITPAASNQRTVEKIQAMD